MLSNYWKQKVIEATVGISVLPVETAVTLRLYTDSVDADGVGTDVSGGSYTPLVTASADWEFASPNILRNQDVLDFVQASANWGTIVSAAIWNTAGTFMLLFDDLQTVQPVNSGNVARFQIQELRFTWT